MRLGWLELLIVAVVGFILFSSRWRRGWPHFGGGGPFQSGFGTVPVYDPPPPREPDSKRDTVCRSWGN